MDIRTNGKAVPAAEGLLHMTEQSDKYCTVEREEKMKRIVKKVSWMCMTAMALLMVFCMNVSAEPKAFDYLLPEADTKVYTADEVGGMSLQVTCYAKNEIYARHGRKFQSSELTEYFNQQPWYYGTIEPSAFSESLLNGTEAANVQTLAAREKALSWDGKGYVLDQPGYDFAAVNEYLYGDGYNILDGLEVYATSGSAFFDTDYFYILCPVDPRWSYIQLDRNSVEFYYAPARDAGYGGHIVTIEAYDWADNSYSDLPSWQVCGLSNDKKYVAIYPTDVQFDPNDQAQGEAYRKLLDWAWTMDVEATDGSNPFTVEES